MRKDGTGRSNALPICQVILGAAIAVLGPFDALSDTQVPWLGWLFVAMGITQIVAVVIGIRRNQRLDRAEDDRG